jgi:hypothetical protein
VASRVLLRCDPPGGTHSDPERACEALEEVGGNPAGLRPRREVFCTLQYDPVTASATGIWGDRAIRFERTFGNSCLLWAETGPVFAFWNSWDWSSTGSWRPWHHGATEATGAAKTTEAASAAEVTEATGAAEAGRAAESAGAAEAGGAVESAGAAEATGVAETAETTKPSNR